MGLRKLGLSYTGFSKRANVHKGDRFLRLDLELHGCWPPNIHTRSSETLVDPGMLQELQ